MLAIHLIDYTFCLQIRYNMAMYCNLKLNMFVCAACLNTNSEGAQKLLDHCDPKRFLLVELDVRKSASILHIEKTVMNLLSRHTDLGTILHPLFGVNIFYLFLFYLLASKWTLTFSFYCWLFAEFSYLVNNAGVMCFGEFEWQTNAIIEHQINVNLFGTINFTRSFLPLARKHKTRIINVTSHCALEVDAYTQSYDT